MSPYVHPQGQPEPTPIPGIAHATWAGQAEGLSQLSVWRQTLAPGSGTPPHHHDCDEIVLCEAGAGELRIGDEVHPFGAGQTLSLPGLRAHQIVNTGPAPLEIVGVLAQSPVRAYLPDGQLLELPWRS